MVVTLLLLAVLFIAGLINSFFHFPTSKFYAWLLSLFTKTSFVNSTKATSTNTTSTSVAPQRESMPVGAARKKAELKTVFATFDKNGDGFITKQELRESLGNIGIVATERDVEEMMERLDANGDGLIDADEFCQLFEPATRGSGEGEEESGLREAFEVFDKDGDGLISVEELGKVLGSLGLKEGRRMEDCKEMIKKVDVDGDGMVSFDEFKMMMRAGGRFVSSF
ncbi:calmodulin-like protein 3 [Malania oleifera]|uniref:calmodulin-like protein 3 n=1 Tax=Malania oleifera TaxID=397392 RepID=UPI0025AE0FF8|nr:calmodulin-like protein 3 [Malania oleifera]